MTTSLVATRVSSEASSQRIDGSSTPRTATIGLKQVISRLNESDVPLILTLFIAVLATSSAWYINVPIVAAAIVGLIIPDLLQRAGFWYSIAAVLGADVAAHQWSVDNHQYLIVYWCLGLAVAAASNDPERVRAVLARSLIGIVFLFATFWKIVSPDFMDGTFLTYTILTDPRFDEIAAGLGGVPLSDLAANRAALGELNDPNGSIQALELRSTPRVEQVGLFLTWATIMIEGSIALMFLLPDRLLSRWPVLTRLRDPLLMLFAAATYAVAPVVGFGWVLLAMGLTQRSKGGSAIAAIYVGLFLAILGFTAPWADIVRIT